MADLNYEALAKKYQDAPEGGPLAGLKYLFGAGPATKPDVMQEIKSMAPLLNLGIQSENAKRLADREDRKAQTEQSKQMLEVFKSLHSIVEDHWKLPEDAQASQRGGKIKAFKVFNRALGNPYDDTDAESFFTIPGYADTMMKTVDQSMRPELRSAMEAEIKAIPPGPTAAEQREKVRARYVGMHEQEVETHLRNAFALVKEQPEFKGRDNVEPRDVKRWAASKYPELAANPTWQRKLNDVLADDKFVSKYGVRSGEVTLAGEKKREEVLAGGPKVTGRTEDILAGQGLIPMTATPAQIEAARLKGEETLTKRQVAVARQTGADAAELALAKEEAEPLNEKAPLWIHPDKGTWAPPTLTRAEAKKQGFVPVTEGGLTAAATAKAALGQIAEYRSLVTALYPKSTGSALKDAANVQANRGWIAAQSLAANPDVRRLLGLQGAIATLARATGDTANVAVAERQMLKAFALTTAETQESATAVLDQAERILKNVVAGRGIPLGQLGSEEKKAPAPSKVDAARETLGLPAKKK